MLVLSEIQQEAIALLIVEIEPIGSLSVHRTSLVWVDGEALFVNLLLGVVVLKQILNVVIIGGLNICLYGVSFCVY